MAKKKIYDILPPKVAHKVEHVIKDLEKGKNKVLRSTEIPVKKTIKKAQKQIERAVTAAGGKKSAVRRFPVKEVVIGGVIIGVLFGFWAVAKLPKADVNIWPVMETLTLEDTLTASAATAAADSSKKTIPVFAMEEEKTGSETFDATGTLSTDTKATGNITIYNKLEPATPFTLIKGTHFLSNTGKYFIILDKVTIPAAKYEKGKLVPGSATVKVEAKEAGQDHNIGPASFSIPKLSGTVYYYSIIAESKAAMAGGHTGSAKQVTQEDIDNAKEVLTQKLLEEATNALKGKLGDNDILLNSAMEEAVVSFTTDVKADDVSDRFTGQATVKISALIFKKEDINQIAKDAINGELEDFKRFREETMAVEFVSETINVKDKKATLGVKISADTYFSVDENGLADLFAAKPASEIEQIITARHAGNISKTQVDFWPFWVNKAPKDKNRIEVNLMFE